MCPNVLLTGKCVQMCSPRRSWSTPSTPTPNAAACAQAGWGGEAHLSTLASRFDAVSLADQAPPAPSAAPAAAAEE
eukprot:5248592-Pyramimonas_sp.AAC.1